MKSNLFQYKRLATGSGVKELKYIYDANTKIQINNIEGSFHSVGVAGIYP